MKNTILKFGFLSGTVSAAMMFATVPFIDRIGFDRGELFGYTAIFISFLFVYFGVRSYRDNVLGGQITFGRGFNAGLLITLISSMCYVAAWLVVYYFFVPDFIDRFIAYSAEHMRQTGATPAEMQKTLDQANEIRKLYANPLTNAAVTFIEPFPIGFVVTVISAAILRKKA